MLKIIFQIVSAILGLFLAKTFVDGVTISNNEYLIVAGVILGLINFFIKPIVKIITLPLRILTLGLFGIIINMFTIWLADALLVEFDVKGLIPLFWTTMIVWLASFVLHFYYPKKKKQIIIEQ